MTEIDKNIISENFTRCIPEYNAHAHVQKTMAQRLETLIFDNFNFKEDGILEAGCGTGFLTEILLNRSRKIITAVDIADCFECMKVLSTAYKTEINFIRNDIEEYIKATHDTYSAFFSNAAFQWMHDMPSLLLNISAHLTKNGMLAFSTFGPDNLLQVRSLTKIGLEYLSKGEIAELLCDNYKIIHISEETQTIYFDTPFEVLKHFKETGTNYVKEKIMSKSEIEKFVCDYEAAFSENDKFPLTYNPMYFVAEKK